MKQIVAVAGALLMSAIRVKAQEPELNARHIPSEEAITFVSDEQFSYDHDSWTDVEEIKSSKALHELRHQYKEIDHNDRPVFGILTEPIRGNLSKGENKDAEKIETELSYVPKAHVQFLEQSGVQVVPIDFRLSKDELFKAFDKVNGLYMPGDSHLAVLDEKYRFAFQASTDYCEKRLDAKDHFPVFMMGNSFQTFVRSQRVATQTLKSMQHVQYKNMQLKMLDSLHPSKTYIFDKMTQIERQQVFNSGKFFNSQNKGLKLGDLKRDSHLAKMIDPIALYRNFNADGSYSEENDKHFIAIAEGKTLPIYWFTYDIEAVQFVFEDATEALDNFVLDHSLIARTHAQYISKQIAHEGRLSDHVFDGELFDSLIRQHKLVSIAYSRMEGHKTPENLPKGLNSRDVYLVQ